jgi:hypothetical protein
MAARRLPRGLEVVLDGRSALVEVNDVEVAKRVDIAPACLPDGASLALAAVLAVCLSVTVLHPRSRKHGKATYE